MIDKKQTANNPQANAATKCSACGSVLKEHSVDSAGKATLKKWQDLDAETQAKITKKVNRYAWGVFIIPILVMISLTITIDKYIEFFTALAFVIMLSRYFFGARKLKRQYQVSSLNCGIVWDSRSSDSNNSDFYSRQRWDDGFRRNDPMYPGTPANILREMRQ